MYKKNIILIRSRAIDPNIQKVAKTLSNSGLVVTLLVWDRDGCFFEDKYKKYTTVRFKLKAPYDKISVLLFLPIWWLFEFFYLLFNRFDVIHVSDLDTFYPAIIIKILKKNILYYTIYDFYSQNATRIVKLNKITLLLNTLIEKLEKLGLRFIDHLFLVDESRKMQIKGALYKKYSIIYNSPKDSIKSLVKINFDSNKTVLFYGGILDYSRGIVFALKAITNIPNTIFVIAGIGPCEDIIFKFSQKYPEKIIYLGYVSYEKIIQYTYSSDAVLAFYDPNVPNNHFASPNKLYESMMCGKPIITNEGTSMAKKVKEENCGLVVTYGDVKGLKNALLLIKNDFNLKKFLGINARRAYETKYNWEIMEKKILSIYL